MAAIITEKKIQNVKIPRGVIWPKRLNISVDMMMKLAANVAVRKTDSVYGCLLSSDEE
jgi:hypothetical protein